MFIYVALHSAGARAYFSVLAECLSPGLLFLLLSSGLEAFSFSEENPPSP